MPKLLHITVSPRGDYSVSHRLADAFVTEWKGRNAGGEVITRDLSKQQFPLVDVPWIAGAYATPDQHTPEQKAALKVSDELIAELFSADELLIATPLWNFSLPSQLKAWFDQIVRIDKTFNAKYEGLAAGRKTYVIVASGGNYAPGTPMAKMDQVSGPLQTILGFIGLTDVSQYFAYGTSDISRGVTSMEDYLAKHTTAALSTLLP